jgi:hypothetical protein
MDGPLGCMNRLLAVVAATAAAAAVAAAITIPAGADESSDPDAQFVSCLRAHGAGIPADTRGVAIKQWLIAHEQDQGVNAAMDACDPKPTAPAADELVTCLRAHGLDVPAGNSDVKRWIVEHAKDANAQDAFKACHFNPEPDKRESGGPSPEDLANCLRKSGADLPAGLDGIALKQWIGDHQDSKAVQACIGPVKAPGCGEPGKEGPETRPAPAPTPSVIPDATPTT